MRTAANGVRKMTADDTRIVDFMKARMASDFDYAFRVLHEMHYHFALGKYDNFRAMQDFSSRYPRYRTGECKLSDKQRAYVTSLVSRFTKQYYQMMLSFHGLPESDGPAQGYSEWEMMPAATKRFVHEDYDRTFELLMGSDDPKTLASASRIFAAEALRVL